MNNPFASLDLQFLRMENKSNRNTAVEIRQLLKDVDNSNIKGARDSLVLLLRFHYLLRPNEIASLNICDIDMESGILHVVNRKRNQYLVLCEQDVFYFKRWLAMRKLFSKSSPAFIIPFIGLTGDRSRISGSVCVEFFKLLKNIGLINELVLLL